VHGAVTAAALRFVPDAARLRYVDAGGDAAAVPGERLPATARLMEWVARLNGFLREALDNYAACPGYCTGEAAAGVGATAGGADAGEGGDAVGTGGAGGAGGVGGAGAWRCGADAATAVQSHGATAGQTVVITTFVTAAGAVEPLAPDVERYLLDNGVRHVFVGHKPVGDSPLVFSSAKEQGGGVGGGGGGGELGEQQQQQQQQRTDTLLGDGSVFWQAAAVEVLMCDTSYADQAARGRGCAAHSVALDLRASDVRVRGTLHTGERVDFLTSDPLVGAALPGGWRVKAKQPPLAAAAVVVDGGGGGDGGAGRYWLAKTEGRSTEYEWAAEDEVRRRLSSIFSS